MSTRPQVRQGDVLLVPVESIPTSCRVVPRDNGRVVLAYGEVTGHAHAYTEPWVTQYETDTPVMVPGVIDPISRFLEATDLAILTHEEHGPGPSRGKYAVIMPREYTPWGDRAVQD